MFILASLRLDWWLVMSWCRSLITIHSMSRVAMSPCHLTPVCHHSKDDKSRKTYFSLLWLKFTCPAKENHRFHINPKPVPALCLDIRHLYLCLIISTDIYSMSPRHLPTRCNQRFYCRYLLRRRGGGTGAALGMVW